jgi:hypothetical protein
VLVYCDHVECADPAERLEWIEGQIDEVAAMPAGIDRHSRLVSTLIEAGKLLQGIADAQLAGEGPLNRFLYRLAVCVIHSWDSGFARLGELPAIPAIDFGGEAELRRPEGFAYYAVYPEAYVEAARRLKLSGAPLVIGIRSIGTTLGSIVAAALGARLPVTVRPFGDPFARQAELPTEILDERSHYVIVDEGPGLSGSSFGAVADWLEAHHVPLERIAFLPSHDGEPGPQCSDPHRLRWRQVQRIPADFGGRLPELVRGWASDPLGRFDEIKFAGFGAIGERKLEMARSLHAAKLTLEPVALVHGFLIERRCEGATPLGPHEKPILALAHYVAARANLFPMLDQSGATIAELFEMCRRNISLGLGEEAARAVEDWDIAPLESRVSRVRTDNRMDRSNWLRTPDGCLIKTDAVDHHCAHDLIGCQDPAWDVAGAIVEFELAAAEASELFEAIEQRGPAVDRELLEFYLLAYLAFRLGESALASNGKAQAYESRLQSLLHQHDCRGAPQVSLFG